MNAKLKFIVFQLLAANKCYLYFRALFRYEAMQCQVGNNIIII